ncbi:hypothetical protein GCM10010289_02290 [Streptomyces violascens]|uniref:Uncharacterized protein n=1 Tax=Streptomyces violascens TaxID=67381 RepID=A0ABQ3QF25_9ACTN|nr:hypothetical protein GCM10010289_02290 [Streptomyces violascens]GHI35894.1 hypothetical protein Sviol_03020 [Streptomyces violascens]
MPFREGGHDRVPHTVIRDAGVHEHEGRSFAVEDVGKMAKIVWAYVHPQMFAGRRRMCHPDKGTVPTFRSRLAATAEEYSGAVDGLAQDVEGGAEGEDRRAGGG